MGKEEVYSDNYRRLPFCASENHIRFLFVMDPLLTTAVFADQHLSSAWGGTRRVPVPPVSSQPTQAHQGQLAAAQAALRGSNAQEDA